MKRTIDDLPMVKASTLRAHGYIGPETKTTLIHFDDSGVEYQVGVTAKPLRAALCGRCSFAAVPWAGPAAPLLEDRPACGECVRASGLIYRSQAVRTKSAIWLQRPRLARLNSDSHCVSILGVAGRSTDRANLEFALRRSRIVARKHGVDRAKDQGL